MTRKQSVRYEMLVRVRHFGDTNQQLFTDSTTARDAFAAVGAAVEQLAHHAVLRVAAAQEGRSRTRQARKALSDQLRTIMRTARLLARTSAGIDEPFQLPPYRSDRTLLAAGGGFVEYATPIAAQFVERGLPATFIADLRTAVDTLATAITDREDKRKDRSAANATIRITMAAGMAAVHALDVIVANVLQNDPVTMAAWEHERRIDPVTHSRTVAVAPVTTPSAPAVPTDGTTSAPAAAPAPEAAPAADPGHMRATEAASGIAS